MTDTQAHAHGQSHGHADSRDHSHEHDVDHNHSHAHGHDHGHGHGHDHNHEFKGSLKALLVTFSMTATIFVAQVIGGLISGSLALLSDAMHMLSDSTGMLIAMTALFIGRKAATPRATYGYRRVEVIAAMINALVVTGVVASIVYNAIKRFGADYEIQTGMMLIIAIIGLLANGIGALILMKRQNDSLNMKGAYLHVLSDLLGSVAVIIAGIIIRFTGWTHADSIASLIIAAMVLPRALGLLKDSVSVLLNRVPKDIDAEEIMETLEALPHVQAAHDLHVWTTDGNDPLATCHIVVAESVHTDCDVLDAVQAALREFGIEHSTIQLERPAHINHEMVCD
ncbi:cation diffusion facilitator family transporter [Corynebacterium pyruviciproducens ATCC BAA-1742]|uniref:Cation diffusion facilitator family transporter n=1 Tax=Corynebacterium pyruviciproducens ATCC BAA-1742 TaxID=1125779 RepID=S3A4B8_9CORY|nr:cation diffusion facilitator family transporter [Corynebacterium pyruviciproducens]EPD71069.1 cation diffusion facilitator family transporter [Corynebacterium pyruviciproducens ATCC BAA-1742]